MTPGRWIGASVALAVVGFVVFVMAKGFGADPHAVPFELGGKPAPAFTLKRLDTGAVMTSAELAGKPTVLNFWATWCGPCKQEHPVLEAAAKRYGKEMNFVGIVFEDTEENTKRFLDENGWSITQLFDPKSTVAVDFGVAGVPETYFVTKDGRIASKYAAPLDRFTMHARLADIADDATLPGRIAEATEKLAALKLPLFTKDPANVSTFVKSLAFDGADTTEILNLARQADADEARRAGASK